MTPMTRLLRLLTPVLALAVPIALALYHSGRNFGAWNNIDVRYNPLWLVAYGLAFAVAAFIFGVPSLIHRANQVILGSLLAVLLPLALASIVYLLYNPYVPRLVVFGSATFLFIGFACLSFLHGLFHGRLEGTDRAVLIIGPGERALLDEDQKFPSERKFMVVGVVDPRGEEPIPAIEAIVEAASPTLLVMSAAAQLSEQIVAHATMLHERGMRVRSLTAFYEEWLGKLPLGELERSGLWFDIRDVHELHFTRMKRVMDVVVALCLLPVFATSMPIVLFGNAVGNRGPLFFRQERVGQRGRVFRMWKYRTMTAHDSVGGAGQWTAENDPRITRFGRLLRLTHVDELPQVINVLLGNLSIVGPRPEQVHYVEELTEKIPFYGLRHIVKPGITGWAQVKYPYGASEQDALEKLQYELFYLKHQSPSLDMRVCARTVRSMLFREGR